MLVDVVSIAKVFTTYIACAVDSTVLLGHGHVVGFPEGTTTMLLQLAVARCSNCGTRHGRAGSSVQCVANRPFTEGITAVCLPDARGIDTARGSVPQRLDSSDATNRVVPRLTCVLRFGICIKI